MGATSEQTATKRIETFYNNKNLPVRRVQTGLMEDGENWLLTNYYKSDYDESGNLLMSHSLQYGIYDQNNYALKAVNDTIDYAYDEAGRLVEENIHAKKTVNKHSYDTESNLFKTEIFKNGTLTQTLQYRHFTLGGPKIIVSEATASYNCYTAQIEYDDQGNKLSEHRSNTDGVLTFAEYWTYTDGLLTLYEKKGISGGKEVDSQRTTYEMVDDETLSKSYTYSNGEWKLKGGSTCKTSYVNFNSVADGAELVSAIPNVEESSVELTMTIPEVYLMVDCYITFNIYRDGLLIDNAHPTETTFKYIDKNVDNGTHEYFVQTVVSDSNGKISNFKTATLQRTYPHATNLRATAAEKASDGSYKVTLAWNAPTITEDMKFVNHNIMKIGTYYTTPMLEEEEAITDNNVTTATVSFGIDAVQTLYVQSRYAGGTSCSDTIVIDATKFVGKASDETRLLRTIETYGDAQGADQGITKKEVTYYGKDNRVERVAMYSKTLGTDGSDPNNWTIYEYISNIYSDNGLLEKQYTQQYGRYNYGEMGFRAAQDTTYYKYNDLGQKVLVSNKMGYTEYEYDEDGSLTKEHIVEYAVPTNIEQTITYSSFAGKDRPTRTESTGTRSSAMWTLETEYNERGNKTSERKLTYKTSTQTWVPSQLQEFYYNESGELESDTVFTIKIVNDIEQYNYKSFTTYEPEEGNTNRIKVVKKVWDSILKKFGNPKTWNVYEYAELNGDKYAPTLTAESGEEGTNAITLTVDLPSAQRNAMSVINVYRNGIEIAHAINYFDENHYTTDEYGLNGKWTYTDSKVANGTYDYYVEFAQLNATMTDIEMCRNVSNVVFAEFNTELPSPTNLREISRRTTTTENTEEGTIETNIFVSLAWDAPENAEQYGLERYEVMIIGSQLADNYDEKDKLKTEYEIAMRGLERLEIRVDAVYSIGRASSETIVIEETPTVIEAIKKQLPNDNRLYNLNGQPVDKNFKGIVISRDKKVYVK